MKKIILILCMCLGAFAEDSNATISKAFGAGVFTGLVIETEKNEPEKVAQVIQYLSFKSLQKEYNQLGLNEEVCSKYISKPVSFDLLKNSTEEDFSHEYKRSICLFIGNGKDKKEVLEALNSMSALALITTLNSSDTQLRQNSICALSHMYSTIKDDKSESPKKAERLYKHYFKLFKYKENTALCSEIEKNQIQGRIQATFNPKILEEINHACVSK